MTSYDVIIMERAQLDAAGEADTDLLSSKCLLSSGSVQGWTECWGCSVFACPFFCLFFAYLELGQSRSALLYKGPYHVRFRFLFL